MSSLLQILHKWHRHSVNMANQTSDILWYQMNNKLLVYNSTMNNAIAWGTELYINYTELHCDQFH